MNEHPYVRAYLAGVGVPSVLVLGVFAGFLVARYVYDTNLPIERVIVFPLALVPNLWGVWNILYEWLSPHRRLPLGLHGAILPVLVLPLAFLSAMRLHIALPSFFPAAFGLALPVILIAYYLLWKYAVAFLNELVGLGRPSPARSAP